jgi:putative nucleotidyltransferase with HDIG domain
MEAISTLVLGQELFDAEKSAVTLPGFDLEELGKHSLETAVLAKAVALHEGLSPAMAESALLAGVLHDVGRLVFATRSPAKEGPAGEWLEQARQQMDADHAVVGAYLLGMWGFPEPLVEALAWHHMPSRSGETSLGLCGLVHIGDQLSHEREIDAAYLESLGLTQKVDEWRALRS